MDHQNQEVGFVVSLNVGGCHYTASLPVLCKYNDSRLAAILRRPHVALKDGEGRLFIDRDGTNFGHILNFLRDGRLPPANKVKEVYQEAQYYKIEALVDALRSHRSVFEDQVHASFSNEFPEALEKATEVTNILRKRFAETLSRPCQVILQFAQEKAWKTVRKIDNRGDVYLPPQELNEGAGHENHTCPSPDVQLGEMSGSDRTKILNFFERHFATLGYEVAVSEKDCGNPVWCHPICWGNGTEDTTVYCAKKLHILTFT